MNRSLLLALLAASLLVAGCAQKQVPLTYMPVTRIGTSCDKSVAVARFADARKEAFIGKASAGSDYTASGDVGEWVAKALVAELGRNGCQASYVDSPAAAAAAFVITGEVDRVYFTRPAYASYTTEMDLKVVINAGGHPTYRQTYHAETKEDGYAPTEAEILRRDLQEAMQQVLPDIIDKLK